MSLYDFILVFNLRKQKNIIFYYKDN